MAQIIKNANIFGRVGTGIGKGLAEQVPKEIERSRLASGLKELGEQKGQTPFQQFAALSSIPGITPQMIESGAKLLQNQSRRDAYVRNGNQENVTPGNASPSIEDIKFANLNKQQQPPSNNQRTANVGPEEFGQPQAVPTNPLDEKLTPAKPWSPKQRDEDIGRVWDSNPNLTFDEVKAISADNESRYLAAPAAEQAIYDAQLKKQGLIEDKLKNELGTLLQADEKGNIKFGEDLTGEQYINIRRGVEKDLRQNPNASLDDVVHDWATRALNLSKSNKTLDTLSQRDIWDQITKQGQTFDKLKGYQKEFANAGNSEEYYNKLKSAFKLSPQAAAYFAYPISDNINRVIKEVPSNGYAYNPKATKERMPNSRKLAENVINNITGNDSPLAIAMHIKDKYPLFDQNAFFNELRENKDRLTSRQRREVDEGESQNLPTWGDIATLPFFGGQL